MNVGTWISIRDGEIVGTPFGPDIPNGKYLLVERLDSDGGQEPQVIEALCQYRDDLRHTPSGDSRERRLVFVTKVIAALEAIPDPAGGMPVEVK